MRDDGLKSTELWLYLNGGMDFDLMTRTTEDEVAEFIMSYIWPNILSLRANDRLEGFGKGLLEGLANPVKDCGEDGRPID